MNGKLKDGKKRVVAELLRRFFAYLQGPATRGSNDLWMRAETRAATLEEKNDP